MTWLDICIGVGCAVMSICLFAYMVKRWDFRDDSDDGGKEIQV